RRAVTVAERFAEGRATSGELAAARRAAQDFVDEYTHRYDYPWPIARSNANDPLEMAATAAWGCALDDALDAARASAHNVGRACGETFIDQPVGAEGAHLCALLRHLAGNPFRPAAAAPAWRPPTVRAVAPPT